MDRFKRATGAAAKHSAETDSVVVREIACKTILNRSGISDYCLNCYVGCGHGCAYCYARFMQRFHPHPEPWGAFVDVKVNAAEVLERQLRRARPGEVFVSSACDGWQPIEAERGLTRLCCQMLLERGFNLHILTKNALVLRDLDMLVGRSVTLGVTVTTLDERLRELWEPQSSGVGERFDVIGQGHRAGLKTSVMFGPLLPFLSDSQRSIDSLFERAAELAIDQIWVDALNLRPRVWQSVENLLRKEFPDLREEYSRILFGGEARHAYLTTLRRRVEQSMRRFRLTTRTTLCF